MNLRQTAVSLSILCLVTCSYVAAWTFQGYLASRPAPASGQVKGASTDSSILAEAKTPTDDALASYPGTLPQLTNAISAKEFALYHMESGKLVASSATMEQVPIASTTKLMNVHVVRKYATNLNAPVTVSSTAASVTGSLMNIYTGETFTVKDLMYGMMLVSGNDAGHALSEYVGGILLNDPAATPDAKTARFVQEMNNEAARLGMKDTHYADPVGLMDTGHSTALDLAKISSIDLQDSVIQPIMDTGDITVTDSRGYAFPLHNSDRLIEDAPYAGTIGGKTGFTDGAGHCLVTAARRGGQTYIAVILNTYAYTTEASAIEARKLLDYGFSLTHWQ